MSTESGPGAAEPEKKRARQRSTKPSKSVESVFPDQKIKSKTETEYIPFETQEELASRLKREEADAWNERLKGLMIYGVFALLLIATTGSCLYVVVTPSPSYQPKTLKLASTYLQRSFRAGRASSPAKLLARGRPDLSRDQPPEHVGWEIGQASERTGC